MWSLPVGWIGINSLVKLILLGTSWCKTAGVFFFDNCIIAGDILGIIKFLVYASTDKRMYFLIHQLFMRLKEQNIP